MTQSFCEFVTESCYACSGHAPATCRSTVLVLIHCIVVNDSFMFYYSITIFSLLSSIGTCFLRKRIRDPLEHIHSRLSSISIPAHRIKILINHTCKINIIYIIGGFSYYYFDI